MSLFTVERRRIIVGRTREDGRADILEPAGLLLTDVGLGLSHIDRLRAGPCR